MTTNGRLEDENVWAMELKVRKEKRKKMNLNFRLEGIVV
jgi:hypothetical protein